MQGVKIHPPHRGQFSPGGDNHHLFRQLAKQSVDYVAIPRVTSEARRYLPCALLPPEVIASDLIFACADPDGLQFAILSSSMFITWQKAIGGRLKSDMRFGSTLTWYTLPLPAVTRDRAAIIAAGKGILEARSLHPERSLAQHYSPLTMDPSLVAAHAKLDRLVDQAFGAKKKVTTNEERARILFERYAEMTASIEPPCIA